MDENFKVYVLKSLINHKRYTGYTEKELEVRLNEHNTGHNIYTKKYKPFKMIYFEKGYCKKCAIKREQFLKSGQGRKFLDILEQTNVE